MGASRDGIWGWGAVFKHPGHAFGQPFAGSPMLLQTSVTWPQGILQTESHCWAESDFTLRAGSTPDHAAGFEEARTMLALDGCWGFMFPIMDFQSIFF